jgi:hypothetical protein
VGQEDGCGAEPSRTGDEPRRRRNLPRLGYTQAARTRRTRLGEGSALDEPSIRRRRWRGPNSDDESRSVSEQEQLDRPDDGGDEEHEQEIDRSARRQALAHRGRWFVGKRVIDVDGVGLVVGHEVVDDLLVLLVRFPGEPVPRRIPVLHSDRERTPEIGRDYLAFTRRVRRGRYIWDSGGRGDEAKREFGVELTVTLELTLPYEPALRRELPPRVAGALEGFFESCFERAVAARFPSVDPSVDSDSDGSDRTSARAWTTAVFSLPNTQQARDAVSELAPEIRMTLTDYGETWRDAVGLQATAIKDATFVIELRVDDKPRARLRGQARLA